MIKYRNISDLKRDILKGLNNVPRDIDLVHNAINPQRVTGLHK